MNITLEHPAVVDGLVTSQGWEKLLGQVGEQRDVCKTFGCFTSRIEGIAEGIAANEVENEYYHNSEVKPGGLANKFKGDVFEVFVELLIKMSPIDERIGIHDYHPVFKDDVGVDGYGIGFDGKPATVQIKYRQFKYELNYVKDRLSHFSQTSTNVFEVDPTAKNQLLIVTSCQGLDYKTRDHFFRQRVRCIAVDSASGCMRSKKVKQTAPIPHLFSLQTMVNGNIFFWKTFFDKVK